MVLFFLMNCPLVFNKLQNKSLVSRKDFKKVDSNWQSLNIN